MKIILDFIFKYFLIFNVGFPLQISPSDLKTVLKVQIVHIEKNPTEESLESSTSN